MSVARLPPSLPLRVVGKSRITPMLGSPGNLGLAVLTTSRGPGSETQPCYRPASAVVPVATVGTNGLAANSWR